MCSRPGVAILPQAQCTFAIMINLTPPVGTVDKKMKKIQCEDYRKQDIKIIRIYLATFWKLLIKV